MSSNNKLDHTKILEVVSDARDLAKELDHEFVTLEHFLRMLINQKDIQKIFTDLKVDLNGMMDNLDNVLTSDAYPRIQGIQQMETALLGDVLQRSVARAVFSTNRTIVLGDVLISMLEADATDSPAIILLQNAGLTPLVLKNYMSHGVQGQPNTSAPPQRGLPGEEPRQKDISNKEEAEQLLAKYADNLNEVAGEGLIDPVIGRETEIDTLIQISARRIKNNAIMVGEPGVGKTAIAEGLALKIQRKEVPEVLFGSTVYSLNIGNLIAGTKYRGEFEDRMKHVLKALTFVDKPILFIDETHMIMGAGAGGSGSSMDVANLLKPALAKGKLRCIGSTTYDEYQKHFEKDRALLRRFQRIDVLEPSIENAKLIMHGLKQHYETFHGVTYTDEAISQAVELTSKYVQNRFLPDKAIDVIDSAGARQRVAPADKRLTVIDEHLIQLEVSRIAKIPEQTVQADEKAKLQTLESDLKGAVFGQNIAIDTLTDAVMVSRAGLRDPGKPAGSYLFSGPTGVGKTETVKQLAKTLGVPLIRFDMSEYMEKHSVAKLIGAPPGYVGHGEGGSGSGLLTTEIENKPHSILLLDEIEKAHPDVYNILLQVMDDGRLTNSAGKTVRFDNVMVIMTSNAGAANQAKPVLGFSQNKRSGEDDKAIKSTFAPEFINRLDAIVKFNALAPENMSQVVDKFLATLNATLGEQKLSLQVSDAAKDWLAKKGYSDTMGARPLARVINDSIKKPLSRVIIFDRPAAGTAITVELEGDGLIVK